MKLRLKSLATRLALSLAVSVGVSIIALSVPAQAVRAAETPTCYSYEIGSYSKFTVKVAVLYCGGPGMTDYVVTAKLISPSGGIVKTWSATGGEVTTLVDTTVSVSACGTYTLRVEDRYTDYDGTVINGFLEMTTKVNNSDCATATPKPTAKPTVAPTPRPTVAPTPTPTVAPTPKPTVKATVKATATPKPTVKATASVSAKPSASASAVSASASVAPTISASPTPSATPSPSISLAPSASQVAIAVVASTPSAAPGPDATSTEGELPLSWIAVGFAGLLAVGGSGLLLAIRRRRNPMAETLSE